MTDAGGAEMGINQNIEPSKTKITDQDKIRILKKSVDCLYGEKRPPQSREKELQPSDLKAIADWRKSEEVKSQVAGARLIQGGEEKQKPVEPTEQEPPLKPEVAPTEKIDEEPGPAPVGEAPVKPPELESTINVGNAVDKTRIEGEIGGLAQHDRAREKPARGFWRGLLTPITNPREFTRNLVQNTLFKGTFDARSMGFSRSIMEIARTKHAGLDSSIPFEMPQDVLDKSIEEGRKMRRNSGISRRLGWTVADIGSGLTGLYQNFDMVFARRWFEENGKPLVDAAKKTSLAEQTELGERFALEGNNEDVVSKEMGEVRYLLNELITDKKILDIFQSDLKSLISQYARGQINDEEL